MRRNAKAGVTLLEMLIALWVMAAAAVATVSVKVSASVSNARVLLGLFVVLVVRGDLSRTKYKKAYGEHQ